MLQGHENKCGDFAETTAFERYGVKTSEKSQYAKSALAYLDQVLARSAHRGRIKLLRGYVSKSSAALNPLTITQLASERYALRGLARAQRGYDNVTPTRTRDVQCR